MVAMPAWGAGRRSQDDAGENAGNGQRSVAFLLFKPARVMTLTEVGNLVGHHGGKFVFALGREKSPACTPTTLPGTANAFRDGSSMATMVTVRSSSGAWG